MTDSLNTSAGTPQDDTLAMAFGEIGDSLDAREDTTVGRPSDAVLSREFRLLAAMLSLESRRLSSLADELGTSKAPRDEVIYMALSEGADILTAGRSIEKAAQWKTLRARLAAANPGVLPPVKPVPEDASR
jgi:hypothetical protein